MPTTNRKPIVPRPAGCGKANGRLSPRPPLPPERPAGWRPPVVKVRRMGPVLVGEVRLRAAERQYVTAVGHYLGELERWEDGWRRRLRAEAEARACRAKSKPAAPAGELAPWDEETEGSIPPFFKLSPEAREAVCAWAALLAALEPVRPGDLPAEALYRRLLQLVQLAMEGRHDA
jgi:hypothetical protein